MSSLLSLAIVWNTTQSRAIRESNAVNVSNALRSCEAQCPTLVGLHCGSCHQRTLPVPSCVGWAHFAEFGSLEWGGPAAD
jgi:hypothetical protein